MCIYFKNINSACLKDYYPLLEIDLKTESMVGFLCKCVLDTYKGYHQVQMAGKDEEKTAFYTDQCTYCYAKMSFGLKNAGATYQRWTEDAEIAFQELKKTILNLLSLITSIPKEMLYAYLDASQEAVSAVLLAVRKGTQCPIHYVSRTLHDAEENYALLKKLALALRHVSRRLRRYFKAHPIKVLVDFNNEVPVGTNDLVLRSTPYTVDHHTDCKEEWVLYTDKASSIKGVGVGLVLISPTKTEYTYALRLNFTNINNLAEYEALLAGLRIAKKMKVQSLSKAPQNFDDFNYDPWPFFQWGIDMLGPLPEAPWKVKFKLPIIIVTDNGTNFVNDPFKGWCKKLNIMKINMAVAHPQTNGLVERANRSLMERIKTRLGQESNVNEEEMRLNLDLLQERREAAAIREAMYKIKIKHYYNKRVHLVSFWVGDYVYRRNEASRVENLGKLGPKCKGPYLVIEAYQNGSYKVQTMDDSEVPRTWHEMNLRKCYL
ncbi:reverse transcriptase domain-containing protein [Tanacetum coccineum]